MPKLKRIILICFENSVALKKNLLNIIDDVNIDELYFEFIEGANIHINNELIISKATIDIASERKLTANKVFNCE